MTNLERAELIRLQAEELAESIRIYEKEKQDNNIRFPTSGYYVAPQHSRESIRRRIVHLRQSLLVLKEGL